MFHDWRYSLQITSQHLLLFSNQARVPSLLGYFDTSMATISPNRPTQRRVLLRHTKHTQDSLANRARLRTPLLSDARNLYQMSSVCASLYSSHPLKQLLRPLLRTSPSQIKVFYMQEEISRLWGIAHLAIGLRVSTSLHDSITNTERGGCEKPHRSADPALVGSILS